MVLVVGGQSRKVGKTSVVTGLIRALRYGNWTAVKITHHHDVSGWLLEQETAREGDSGRYLSAGAIESWFLRCAPDCLAGAIPALRAILHRADHAIIESNSVLDHLTPDLYVVVLDPHTADRKASMERNLHLADAIVAVDAECDSALLPLVVRGRPCFRVSRPDFDLKELAAFVERRMVHSAGNESSNAPG